MLACMLDENKFDVSIYERNEALGRKFLVAGDGGLNLSHSEELQLFISRYSPSAFFQNSISQFTNDDLRKWLLSIGIETFIGSSKRIFPKDGTKPIEVLNAFISELTRKKVSIRTNHLWKGWKNNSLLFDVYGASFSAKADICIFSLGGASWKVTGSDGMWTNYFSERGIKIIPFQASNCAFAVKWKPDFIEIAEGKALKNISIMKGGQYVKGEVVITKFGLEGGAIYALSKEIRSQLNDNNEAQIFIDLKPAFTLEQIIEKLSDRGTRSVKKLLSDKLNLNEVQIALLKSILSKQEFTSPLLLSERIKKLPLNINSAAPIDDAISTVGGISLDEIDDSFQFKKLPNHYAIGEMLDWDAPTGGYLLHGCFSMAYCLAKHLNSKYSL